MKLVYGGIASTPREASGGIWARPSGETLPANNLFVFPQALLYLVRWPAANLAKPNLQSNRESRIEENRKEISDSRLRSIFDYQFSNDKKIPPALYKTHFQSKSFQFFQRGQLTIFAIKTDAFRQKYLTCLANIPVVALADLGYFVLDLCEIDVFKGLRRYSVGV